MLSRKTTLCFLSPLLLAVPSYGQFDEQWAKFTLDPSALPGGAGSISEPTTEVDFAWGDLDNDGDVDVIAVRKQHFTTTGRRTNILLVNEGGQLVDRTATLATASDVGGDLGFLTPTNDRDVVLSDVDSDGWLDVITAPTLSNGASKAIGHPRIYMNLGNDLGGNWLGLRYEDSRIPQMVHFGSGNPANPDFCAVSAGDVTGNGAPDLYFGDYGSMEDRLLINDGNGYFTDQSQLRMTETMLKSAFGNSVVIADFNGDGHNDILKDTALAAPQYVAISYNDPSAPGFFNIFDDFHSNAPYHTSHGDLNNDGRLDVVVSDDSVDRFRINTGNDAFGRVVWSPSQTFEFVSGGDDGFGSNNLIADLNGDGWDDVLICDVDVDIPGYDRRLHIYHNRATTVGQTTISLREEREQSGGAGWHGVVGMSANDMKGTHDVAVFDIDNDGDNDMLISRLAGTFVWMNDMSAPQTCGYTEYGVGVSPANILTMAGSGTAQIGTAATLTTTGLVGATSFNIVSHGQLNMPFLGGVLLVDNNNQIFPMATLPAAGGTSVWNLPIPNNPVLVGFKAYFQSAALDGSMPSGLAFSNGVEMVICP